MNGIPDLPFCWAHSIAAAMLTTGDTYTPLALHADLFIELSRVADYYKKIGGGELLDKGIIACTITAWQMVNRDKEPYDESRMPELMKGMAQFRFRVDEPTEFHRLQQMLRAEGREP